MNQIQKSLLTSAAVFALGAGALVFISLEKKDRIQTEERENEEKKLFGFKGDEPTALTITRGTERISVEKSGNDWKLVHPIQAPADEANVVSIIGALTALEAKGRFKQSELKPEIAGLDKPSVVVEVKLKDGKSTSLQVGKKNAFDESVYVRAGEKPEDSDVITVPGYSLSAFDKSVLDLRNKRVATLTSPQVDALDVMVNVESENAISFKAIRSGQPGQHQFDDGWQLTAPVTTSADREVLAEMVNTLTGLKATAFVDDAGTDLAQWGLDKPAVVVKFSGAGKEETLLLSLRQHGAAQKAYAKRSDQPNVVEVPESGYSAGFKSLWMLRDKRVAPFDMDGVDSIAMSLPEGKELVVVKENPHDADEPTWKITSPTTGEAKPWKVSAMLYSLHSLKFKKILEENLGSPVENAVLAKHGLDKPSRTVTLKAGSGKTLAKFVFGSESLGDAAAMAEGGNAIGLVEIGKLSELPDSAEDLQEKPGDNAAEEVPSDSP